MNSIFGMFMESLILRVSCKVNVKPKEGLHVNFARDPEHSRFHEHSYNWIYCLYLHFIINIYNIKMFLIYELKQFCILNIIVLTV